MRIATTFFLFGVLFSICNAWTLKSYHQNNNNGRENRLVDTFSLSFYGNLGMSRALNGISKIVEGIVSFIDLKVIRAGVDFIFDNFLPFFDEGEENISRQDIITRDGYEFEDTENDAYQHEKEVQNMRRMATIVFGGIFQKQQCWELNMCNIGRAIRENNESAMEFALIMVKKTLPESWHESLNIIEKTQIDDQCDNTYECDSNKDGRNF